MTLMVPQSVFELGFRHNTYLMCHQELRIRQQWMLVHPVEEEDGSRWSVVLQETVTCYSTIHTSSTHQLLMCLVIGTTPVEECVT